MEKSSILPYLISHSDCRRARRVGAVWILRPRSVPRRPRGSSSPPQQRELTVETERLGATVAFCERPFILAVCSNSFVAGRAKSPAGGDLGGPSAAAVGFSASTREDVDFQETGAHVHRVGPRRSCPYGPVRPVLPRSPAGERFALGRPLLYVPAQRRTAAVLFCHGY